MPEQGAYSPDGERAKRLEADREVEATPLPYAELVSYARDPQRQLDLEVAEKVNIARAAGELGLTTKEWHDLRTQLGRPPHQGDV